MHRFLPPFLLGSIAAIALILNTVFWFPWLVVLAVVRLLLPIPALRRFIDPITTRCAEIWIMANSAWVAINTPTRWDIQCDTPLDRRAWYMVVSNHQSWVDIVVLQKVFGGRIPFLKFFLKQQLIWVPFLGLAWWALEFPFMRRHSASYLRKHPEMKGRDLEETRKACQRFSVIPTSVMNFLEGTRLTPAKHARQQSPYTHLLKPKAGGFALALDALGAQFQSVLDVTIYYPDGIPTFWDLLSGRIRRVVVRTRAIPVPEHLRNGDYSNDAAFRARFATWVNQLWAEKDALLTQLSQTTPSI